MSPQAATRQSMGRVLWAVMLLLAAGVSAAQGARFPGTIELSVDASDVERRILRVVETIPVRPGRLVLLYPQWLPGNHAPRGTIDQLAGLTLRAGGQTLAWKRDPLNVFRFETQVPAGASQVTVEFQVATPQTSDQGRVVMTPGVLGLQWNQVVFYPEGHAVHQIPVRASLKLPGSWRYGAALRADPLRRALSGAMTRLLSHANRSHSRPWTNRYSSSAPSETTLGPELPFGRSARSTRKT